MYLIDSSVVDVFNLEKNNYLLKLFAPEIAECAKPGQFLNIKVSENDFPLLRRPFSICNVENDFVYVMFNILGEGTTLLARKKNGDKLNLFGPLGNGFNTDGDYSAAIIVAGGIGAAPFPFLINKIKSQKEIICFIGGKSLHDVVKYEMQNLFVATDDGSLDFKGNVIQLLESKIDLLKKKKIKIFSCGPIQMLKSLKKFSDKYNFNCEISTECVMACGFGICQGCPVESAQTKNKYLLVCKDGPVFNINDVIL